MLSCTTYTKLAPQELRAVEDDLWQKLEDKSRQQQNSAYLVQAKIKTTDFKKKFKLEIYCQGDSVSFYSPGFLGKGTFKGIVYGDSLKFYFPSEKAFYSGLWYDLAEPDLTRWRDVFGLIMDVLNGNYVPDDSGEDIPQNFNIRVEEKYNNISDDSGAWNWNFLFDKSRLKKILYNWQKGLLSVNFWVKGYSDRFPYFKLDRAYINYNNRLLRKDDNSLRPYKSNLRIEFILQEYNLVIPPEKFELHIPLHAHKIQGFKLD